MKANPHEQALLTAAGFTFEHPDHWQRVDTIGPDGAAADLSTPGNCYERSITIADGLSANGFAWEVQISIDDDTQVAPEGFERVEDALAMVERGIAEPGSAYVASPKNVERRGWAWEALTTFAKLTGMDEEDDETVMSDLLCDLMHYCAQHDQSFTAAMDRATTNFEAERLGAE